MIEVAKAHERTCQEYQIHKQAHSMANPSNSYSNPLIQTNALSKSFQKGPPKKTCGKCRRSHNHRECPAHGTTCSKCGHLNHWAQQCRSSGRRNSSTSCAPSLGRPQNRQRHFSSNKPNKGKIYSQKARQWPWQRRRKTLQDECPNSYWSFWITTPSQSCWSRRKRNKGVCKYEC